MGGIGTFLLKLKSVKVLEKLKPYSRGDIWRRTSQSRATGHHFYTFDHK